MNVSRTIDFSEQPGSITDFALTSIPFGYLLCNGQAVSRINYARLFEAIGTTFGAGDGSTTFNQPNAEGRVTVGSNGAGDYILGNTGGEKEVTLTSGEMPSHTHICDSHDHTVWGLGVTQQVTGFDWLSENTALPNSFTISAATPTNSYEGGGAAHSNMQPYMSLTKFIKF